MKRYENNSQEVARSRILALLLLAILASGCASLSPSDEGGNKEAAILNNGLSSGYQTARRAAGFSQAAILYARSAHVDPIVRPVSYVTSVSSLLLKSTGGMLRRVAIGAVQMPAVQGPIPDILRNAEPMDLVAWEAQLDKITGTQQALGEIGFLIDGEEYFTRLEEAIDQATESIDIRTYIFDNDDYAMSIANQLKERSRDLRVRVMLDTLGNMQAMQTDPDSMPADHQPPFSMSMYLEQGSKIKVRNISNPWFTGDHTKTTILDKKVAFVGGMNIGREYRYDWHDLMMEVRGPVVDQLQHDSNKAWARASLFGDLANLVQVIKGKRRHADVEGYPVRVLQTRSFNSQIYKAQVAAIQQANSYILIENAYFSDDRIIYELAKARRRGVDVRVILPARGNHGPVNASNQVAINQMLKHGIRVYKYPGMSHIKAAIFDGWACVGSANFDKLSLQVNKELNLATSDAATVKELLERVFLSDLMISEEISESVGLTIMTKFAELVVDELL